MATQFTLFPSRSTLTRESCNCAQMAPSGASDEVIRAHAYPDCTLCHGEGFFNWENPLHFFELAQANAIIFFRVLEAALVITSLSTTSFDPQYGRVEISSALKGAVQWVLNQCEQDPATILALMVEQREARVEETQGRRGARAISFSMGIEGFEDRMRRFSDFLHADPSATMIHWS